MNGENKIANGEINLEGDVNEDEVNVTDSSDNNGECAADEPKAEADVISEQEKAEPSSETEKLEECAEENKAEATSDDPPVTYAFRWEYSEQVLYDKGIEEKSKKNSTANKKSGWIYALIMSVALILAFSILIAALSLDNISDWFVTTNNVTLSTEEIVEKNFSSTFTVFSYKDDNKGSMGTGFMVNSYGYIVTNYHVVENTIQVVVMTNDLKAYPASVVGYDANKDVAVLYADISGIKAVTLGDSDSAKLGERVVAIGGPRGENNTLSVSDGIISSKDRTSGSLGVGVLQTDAALNPGNSGGPLFDSHGNVIGIVVSKLSYTSTEDGDMIPLEGISFAISINEVKEDIANFIKADMGTPMMGITVVSVKQGESYFYDAGEGALYGYQIVDGVEYKVNTNGETERLTEAELNSKENCRFTAKATGMCVMNITKGLGADGKLKKQDIITKINGVTIETIADTHEMFSKFKVGDVIDVEIVRDGVTMNVEILLGTKEDMLKNRD